MEDNITATEIEERYKTMKPLPDPLTELCIERLAKLMEEKFNLNEIKIKDLQSLLENEEIRRMMEEMAGQPREELGKRQPGERCMYEQERFNK